MQHINIIVTVCSMKYTQIWLQFSEVSSSINISRYGGNTGRPMPLPDGSLRLVNWFRCWDDFYLEYLNNYHQKPKTTTSKNIHNNYLLEILKRVLTKLCLNIPSRHPMASVYTLIQSSPGLNPSLSRAPFLPF